MPRFHVAPALLVLCAASPAVADGPPIVDDAVAVRPAPEDPMTYMPHVVRASPWRARPGRSKDTRVRC